jgi:hypothetical protein
VDTYTKLIRFFHGPFLSAICHSLEAEDNEENKEIVKQIIKDNLKITSMADLTAMEIGEVVTEVARMFAIELGVMLPYPGEPDNVAELTMTEFLALKK